MRLDWCTHEAAKYAVLNWHYSKQMPCGKMVRIGVWEGGQYKGCVLFSRGAAAKLGNAYRLNQNAVCELTRVALREHSAPVSRIVAIALRMLKAHCPGMRLVVSFADANEGHHGGIYQAGNWIYAGQTSRQAVFIDRAGRKWHNRYVSVSGVKKIFDHMQRVPRVDECKRVVEQPKYRYLMPLDQAMREQVAPLARPYPKRPSVG